MNSKCVLPALNIRLIHPPVIYIYISPLGHFANFSYSAYLNLDSVSYLPLSNLTHCSQGSPQIRCYKISFEDGVKGHEQPLEAGRGKKCILL